MSEDTSSAVGSNHIPAPAEQALRADFAARFKGSFRASWLIAAGILGGTAMADDVVQEAAIIALSKFAQFRADSDFNAWIAQIVRHVAHNVFRKERRRRTLPLNDQLKDERGGASDQVQSINGPHADANGDRLALAARGMLPEQQQSFDDQVLSALRRVDTTARACLLLRTVECLEYAEISRLLGIPEGTAMSHVHRTREFLRLNLVTDVRNVAVRPVSGQIERRAKTNEPRTIP